MKKYTFQDLILSEETDVVYVKLSSAEDLINKLTEQNKEMLHVLKLIASDVLISTSIYPQLAINTIGKVEKGEE